MHPRISIDAIVRQFDLVPHPEGGFYREVYRSTDHIEPCCLPETVDGKRNYLTSIYFLIPHGQFSAFHRIAQDELWYFHLGNPITIHIIAPDRTYSAKTLGSDVSAHCELQCVVPAGHWFAAEVTEKKGFGLVSCAVAPGFDFKDFELAHRKALVGQFPEHTDLITKLTR